jgi:hypothetical protein
MQLLEKSIKLFWPIRKKKIYQIHADKNNLTAGSLHKPQEYLNVFLLLTIKKNRLIPNVGLDLVMHAHHCSTKAQSIL